MAVIKSFLILTIVLSTAVCYDLTPADIHQILIGHNWYRTEIAAGRYKIKTGIEGPATNMQKMEWDERIAENAKRYAHKMNEYKHSKMNERIGLYENVCFSDLTHDMKQSKVIRFIKRCIYSWSSEMQNYGIKREKSGQVIWEYENNHAQLLIRADINRIGCGISYWFERKGFLVCQYKSHGRFKKLPYWEGLGYKKGPMCSECPFESKCNRKSGLCECPIAGQGLCSPDNETVYYDKKRALKQ